MRRASFRWVIAVSMIALTSAVALSAEITRSYGASGAIGRRLRFEIPKAAAAV
jgi:hypothetical protein